jgi:hypothetical protein
MRVDLGKFLLVQRDWLTSFVEYKKARAGSALIDATNEDFFCRSHCGCSALAGVSICDLADGGGYGNGRSDLLCTCLCSSEAL